MGASRIRGGRFVGVLLVLSLLLAPAASVLPVGAAPHPDVGSPGTVATAPSSASVTAVCPSQTVITALNGGDRVLGTAVGSTTDASENNEQGKFEEFIITNDNGQVLLHSNKWNQTQALDYTNYTASSQNITGCLAEGDGDETLAVTFTVYKGAIPPPQPQISTKKQKAAVLETLLSETALIYCDLAGVGSHSHIYIIAGLQCIQLLLLAVEMEKIVQDPPDPNFMVIDQPVITPLPPITPGTDITQAEANALNAINTNLANQRGYTTAFLTAINRAQGASLAANALWQGKQTQAAQGFAAQLSAQLAAMPALFAAAQSASLAAGHTATVTATDLASFESTLAASGLPPTVAQGLTAAGLDSAAQTNITQTLFVQDAQAAAALGGGKVPQALTDPTVATGFAPLAYDLTLFSLGVNGGIQYYPLAKPVRLFDSRPGQTACLHPGTPLAALTPLALTATGGCTGIPAGALAVTGNGTVVADVAGSGAGFVTFYPGGASLPLASNLNYTPGQVAPNAFTVGLSGGVFTAYASTRTDLVIDLTGVYGPPGLVVSGVPTAAAAAGTGLFYHPLTAPVRLFDSRAGQSGCLHPSTPLAATTPLALTATGGCTGIPTSALAVVGNGTVIATAGGGAGFVTFYPGGASLPLASNLNYVPGQVAPNAFTVGLSSTGSFNSYASTTTHLAIDVTGYYDTVAAGGLLYTPLAAPVRLFDSRAGQRGCVTPGVPVGGGKTVNLVAASDCTGIPFEARAVTGNGTVVAGGAAGFVTFYPGGASLPLASNLNYVPGQVAPNAFVVGVGKDGSFNSYASTTTDLVIDVTGYFS